MRRPRRSLDICYEIAGERESGSNATDCRVKFNQFLERLG
jgi:hypothetical protein